MSKAKRVSRKSEPFSAGCYTVAGRLFRSRAEAEAWAKANRIPAFKIGLAPPKVDIDALKLSVRDGWTLRVFFDGADPMMVFEHAKDVHAFTVRFSDLVDLASTVKARVRELSRSGALL